VRNIEALFKLNPQIVKTVGDVAYDKDENVVEYDLAAVEAYAKSQEYIAKRQAEYPPITDYIDGVVKGDQDQIDKYIADCLAVKTKYPKGA
jgi:hypothetical protein